MKNKEIAKIADKYGLDRKDLIQTVRDDEKAGRYVNEEQLIEDIEDDLYNADIQYIADTTEETDSGKAQVSIRFDGSEGDIDMEANLPGFLKAMAMLIYHASNDFNVDLEQMGDVVTELALRIQENAADMDSADPVSEEEKEKRLKEAEKNIHEKLPDNIDAGLWE